MLDSNVLRLNVLEDKWYYVSIKLSLQLYYNHVHQHKTLKITNNLI